MSQKTQVWKWVETMFIVYGAHFNILHHEA